MNQKGPGVSTGSDDARQAACAFKAVDGEFCVIEERLLVSRKHS